MRCKNFKNLVLPLLRHLKVDAPEPDDEHSIRIDFRHVQIQLAPLDDEELLIVASLGVLPFNTPPSLGWALLAANDINPVAPPISVTLVQPNNVVVLWTRERFIRLNAAELIVLFERLLTKVNDIICLIGEASNAQASSSKNGGKSNARSSLGGRFNQGL